MNISGLHMQHLCHHRNAICHPNSSYVTNKLYRTSKCGCNTNTIDVYRVGSYTGRAGPQPMGRAGSGFYDSLRAGPGAGLKLQARAGSGLVCNNFAGCGPGLGLTFPGLGRARAYSESHSYFNTMVKDYLHLSIAIRSLFSIL